MDFYFGEKSTKGISVLLENDNYRILIPTYLQAILDLLKITNWARELGGTIHNNEEIIVPIKLKPSDIYYSYYHFVE